ncbi:MAG TPA: small multi-drug export protein [Actinomycetota bacterium]|nr:small multi-drug export protein [Actinomycetota bacterium]
MRHAFAELVQGLPAPLATVVLAMVPIVELRGAIPLAILTYRLPPLEAFAWAVLGNMIPVPIILFFLEPVSDFLRSRSRLFDRFFEKLFDRTRTKHSHRFERWRDLALITFVALPLPLTGAWTGALAAFLFGVRPRRAIPLIGVGVLIAATIVTTLVVSGLRLFGV